MLGQTQDFVLSCVSLALCTAVGVDVRDASTRWEWLVRGFKIATFAVVGFVLCVWGGGR